METFSVIILFIELRRRGEEALRSGVVGGSGKVSGINIS